MSSASEHYKIVGTFTRASPRTQALFLQVLEKARVMSGSNAQLAEMCKTLMDGTDGVDGVGPWHCIAGSAVGFSVRYRQHNIVTARELIPRAASSSKSLDAPIFTITLLRTGPQNATRVININPRTPAAVMGNAVDHLSWATGAARAAVAAGCAGSELDDSSKEEPGNIFAVIHDGDGSAESDDDSGAPEFCPFDVELWSCSSVMSAPEREFCVAALACAYRAQSDPMAAEAEVMKLWKARLEVRYGPQWHAVAANHTVSRGMACDVESDCGSYVEVAMVPRSKKRRALARRFVAFRHLSPTSSMGEVLRIHSASAWSFLTQERVLAKAVYIPSMCLFATYYYLNGQCTELALAQEKGDAPRPDAALRSAECEEYAQSWFFYGSLALVAVICMKVLGLLGRGSKRKQRAAAAAVLKAQTAAKAKQLR